MKMFSCFIACISSTRVTNSSHGISCKGMPELMVSVTRMTNSSNGIPISSSRALSVCTVSIFFFIFLSFLRQNLAQRYKKNLRYANFQDEKWRSIVHRFTDSRICVCWNNLHNNIIILYIIYLLWAKIEDKNLCECVNLWIMLPTKFEKIIFFENFWKNIWRRQFVHRIFAADFEKDTDLALAIVSYLSRKPLVFLHGKKVNFFINQLNPN